MTKAKHRVSKPLPDIKQKNSLTFKQMHEILFENMCLFTIVSRTFNIAFQNYYWHEMLPTVSFLICRLVCPLRLPSANEQINPFCSRQTLRKRFVWRKKAHGETIDGYCKSLVDVEAGTRLGNKKLH